MTRYVRLNEVKIFGIIVSYMVIETFCSQIPYILLQIINIFAYICSIIIKMKGITFSWYTFYGNVLLLQIS